MESKRKTARNHETWLNQYSGGSRRQYERAWRYFEKFLGDKSEAWILANRDAEDFASHLVDFHLWLKEQKAQRGDKKLSDNTARSISNAIRGYMVHVGIPLRLTRQQKEVITKVVSMPEKDYPMSLRTKEQLLRVANPIEEYVLCAGISFGLRISDFMLIRRGQLEPLMDREIPIQLDSMPTIKEGVSAFPFIDKDAHEAIQQRLKEMDMEGRTSPDELMIKFRTKNPEKEVNLILKKLFAKAQIPLGEFRVRFHTICRKFLTDKLAAVCSEDKWKHFVGKKTTSPYVSQEGWEAYKKVMQFTNVNGRKVMSDFTNEQLEKILKQRDQYIESLRTELEILGKRQEETFGMVNATRTQLEGRLAERDGEVRDLKKKFAWLKSVYEAKELLYKQLDPKELEKTIRGIMKECKQEKG